MSPAKPQTSRDLFPGALEMMVLQSLRRQPMHGYALVQHIQQRSNDLLQVEEGSLYPALATNVERGVGEGGMGDLDHQPPSSHLSDNDCRGETPGTRGIAV